MKRLGIIALSIGFATILSACGSSAENIEDRTNEDNSSGANENAVVEEQVDNSGGSEEGKVTDQNWVDELAFEEFEVNAEYSNGEYEANFENENNPEGEIEDSRNGQNIKKEGGEALEELSGILSELNIDENSSKNELLEATTNAFGLDENYSNLEVKIGFINGGEMEVSVEE